MQVLSGLLQLRRATRLQRSDRLLSEWKLVRRRRKCRKCYDRHCASGAADLGRVRATDYVVRCGRPSNIGSSISGWIL
jgi:hypothetical protein